MEPDSLRELSRNLLIDLRALETMLRQGMIESEAWRIGAEQEVFLVDGDGSPSPAAPEVLRDLDDERFTPEIGRFNLEINLEPRRVGHGCLRHLEGELNERIGQVREAARRRRAHVVLAGILPSLRREDLDLAHMTPRPRYAALNQAILALRGGDIEIRIAGPDKHEARYGSIMPSACNTGFHAHLQVAPADFARLYNAAQAAAAPVLATAVNSPLLFGQRLWHETRIALFGQSMDTRGPVDGKRQPRRASFGSRWVERSVLEIFHEDALRSPVLLGGAVTEDAREALAAGRVPDLTALRLHNSTIYRWNRPCYGIFEGRPHLRIENRSLPSGPTPLDEVANLAFWLGLVVGIDGEYGDVRRQMSFADATRNFYAAARLGLDAHLSWWGGRRVAVPTLLLEELLPLARQGLASLGIEAAETGRYLDVVEQRVRTRRTGARWLLDSLSHLKAAGGRSAAPFASLTHALIAHQAVGDPVHTWELAGPEIGSGIEPETATAGPPPARAGWNG